jgi:hypothetical protein
MDTNLTNFFFNIKVFQGDTQINEFEVPTSMIQAIVMKYKFPGSPYDVRVTDSEGTFRFNSTSFNGILA